MTDCASPALASTACVISNARSEMASFSITRTFVDTMLTYTDWQAGA